jgi:general secretion pathway protein D
LKLLQTHLALSRLRSAETVGRASWLAITLTVASVALSGCATASAVRRGERAEQRQDYDLAVVEYTRALRENPDNETARLALDRTRLRASQDHFSRGRRLAATGKLEEALVEFELAADLNPTNGDIESSLRTTREQLRAKAATSRDGLTALETLIKEARQLPPPGLDLPQDVKMPAALTFSDASSRLVFTAIARLANMSLGFDPAFRETPVTVDLRNASLAEALSTVADQTRTFFRVTGARSVLVIPDTPAKRAEYEDEVVQPFYLSNADLKETMDLLRMVLDARRISPMTANSVLTIKDTPERVAAAATLLAAIDKAKPEIIVDVELLEVDRTRLQEYGLQFASPGSPPTGIDGSVSIRTDEDQALSLRALRNLSQSDVLLANLPSLYYRLLKSDTNTRLLANPQLRMTEGSAAQARFGEKLPVPGTTFAPIATGGVPQQPITSYAYETIGVNIDLTPRLHHDDEVTLILKLAVQSVSGVGFGGLPTFGNREISQTIRLRDGETNMLAGLIREDERRVVDGIPGLSDLPAIGRLFGHTRTDSRKTDIILTLTPHIVRPLNVTADDLRAFKVGRDSISPLDALPPALDLPPPPDPAPVVPPPGTVPAPAAPSPPVPPGVVLPPTTLPPGR